MDVTNNTQRQDKSSITRFYDSLAPVYASLRDYRHKRDTDVKNHLVNALAPFNNDTILDIGTGPGVYAFDIAKTAPSCRVVGLDISQTFVDIATERAKKASVANVEFALGNIEKLEFADDSFSKIICAGVISVVGKRNDAVRELSRVLSPGGVLAVREPTRSDSSFSRMICGLPDKSRIRRLCSQTGLLFGHFSPDFMTEKELRALFDSANFSSISFDVHGQDILITATK
ncbi:MAG TPA: methyltransferase domain-containing protein [Actinobacteria bacterium]|nr:methyltransferase domain-containing protein [Actinomycetota bacterium]